VVPREPKNRGGAQLSDSRQFSARAFAALGIVGLRDVTTVMRYVEAWGDRPRPEPGQRVELPTDPWPPTRTGTDGYSSEQGAYDTLDRMIAKHGPQIIAVVARRPEVARAIHGDEQASLEQIRQWPHQGRVPETPRPQSPVLDAMRKLLIDIGAESYAHSAKVFDKAVNDRRHEEDPWRPKEQAAILKAAKEGVQHGQNVIDMLTPVSDEDLEKLLAE